MDDIRTNLISILVDIIHVKLFCQQRIPLNCDHGIFFAVYIFCIDIYLRSVESSLSNVFHEWDFQFCQDVTDILLCLIPYIRISDIFLTVVRIPFGQMVGYILFYTQSSQALLSQCDTIFKFFHHLIRTNDQMSLGNRELTNTCQSVHLTGILISEQSRSLAVTKRQITVGFLACFVYIILERAGHRAKCKDFFILLLISQYKHSVFIVIPVAGNLIKVTLCHQRSLGTYIAPVVVFLILDPSL